MAKAVIRLGDDTSHGGKVVTASARKTIDGIPAALWGDRCSCPIEGYDACAICGGEPEALYGGLSVAREWHKTGCGAVFMPFQRRRCNVSPRVKAETRIPVSGIAAIPVRQPMNNQLFKGEVRFMGRRAKTPLRSRPFRLVDENSKEVPAFGSTDAEGVTKEIATKKSTPFGSHFGADPVLEQVVVCGLSKVCKGDLVEVGIGIKKRLVIMLYTKLNHDDGAFQEAAETRRREIEVAGTYAPGRDPLPCDSTGRAGDLEQKWGEVQTLETNRPCSVEEMHLFTHGSKGGANGDGVKLPVSGANHGTPEKPETEALPKLLWTPFAKLRLYGCARSSSQLYLWAFWRRRNGLTGKGGGKRAIPMGGKQP